MPHLPTLPAHPRQLVYIAGPLAGDTLAERQKHYRRIVALGRFAVDRGFTPVVPHLTIGALFGWPRVGESPEARAVGLALSMQLLGTVIGARGVLWALCRDDGFWSAGTAAEVARADEVIRVWSGTWAEWCAVGVQDLVDGP